MKTHTPGPWSVGERNKYDNTISVCDGKGRMSIAYVNPRPFHDDRQEKNAALIAAAPDLFEAAIGGQDA